MVVYNSEYGGQKQGGGGLASLEHYFTIHTMYNIYIYAQRVDEVE